MLKLDHIFIRVILLIIYIYNVVTLQIVNLQAELAYTQARISTLQHHRTSLPPQHPTLSSSNPRFSSEFDCDSMAIFDASQSKDQTSPEMASFCNSVDQEILEDGDLQSLAREYVSRYFPGVRFRPPN